MADRYEPSTFESKWQQRWADEELFATREEEARPKFYGMDFFPYPSGAGLSVGHCRNYVPTDVICRMKYMQGYNVLHPMGFDAFGLPAENEAIKRKTHPAPMIDQYAANYKRQMDLVGISYDWSRSFKSSDPSYYKWTQWIFELLYKRGLAYRKMASVNWDPVDKTVLADEEIVGGRAERSGAVVEKKWIPQWFFKITDYAQQLIDDLDTIDWPDGIKAQQRNWIGRSEGVQFTMKVSFEAERGVGHTELGVGEKSRYDLDADPERQTPNAERQLGFDVFTTRIDTIFGMTFCVLSPEHALVDQIAARVSLERQGAIREYRQQAKLLTDTDRTAVNREKTGVFTGAYAVNPANGKHVPIWLADYVLATYGTGAIMAVPAGDQRDLEFAVKFDIPVTPIQNPPKEFFAQFLKSWEELDYESALRSYHEDPRRYPQAYVAKDVPLIDAGEYTGMLFDEASRRLGEWIEALGIGERKVQYKLRDWLISRQRYWGCPIPVIHGAEGELQLVPEPELPVYLPPVDHYEPAGDGSSPLAHIDEFVNVCDRDGRLGRRETDTMGGFACSSWYFLRFCDPHNDDEAWSQKAADYWMPVDCYVGGAEHAVMHLLYARFWTKVFFDAGLVKVREPFLRLQNQGQVLALTPYRKPKEGEKLDIGEEGILISFDEAKTYEEGDVLWRWSRMSKSKGNVVTPDEAKEQYGADALRMFLLFVAPFNADVNWSSEGMQGSVRFLSRIFRLITDLQPLYESDWRTLLAFEELDNPAKELRRATHQTIQRCTEDIDRFQFNTYVSWLMKYVNSISDVAGAVKSPSRAYGLAVSEAIETLILLLSPGAPHSADELWEQIGKTGFTYREEWPAYDPKLATEDTMTIAVQVNGKLRDTLDMAVGSGEAEVVEAAKASKKVQTHLEGKTIRKVIYIPGKLVNIVAN
ncbi:MAG TPA: leucine--tRNA ligase [Fimbriimonadaceae bacterium]|nr:leucine--tRNA ligase [Fimbriimonadaceae bacterium]